MSDKQTSPAMRRFLQSMNIGYIEWHDGIGYDLAALKELQGAEREQVEGILIAHKDRDWRDVEALAALGTPRAIQALHNCLESVNKDARLFAVRYLKEMNIADRVEEIVTETLPQTRIGYGMTYALALAKDYPTNRIREKLLWCALHGNDDIRIHCAAMALYLYGAAPVEFDREQEIIFEFREKEEASRLTAFRVLCDIVGVEAERFL